MHTGHFPPHPPQISFLKTGIGSALLLLPYVTPAIESIFLSKASAEDEGDGSRRPPHHGNANYPHNANYPPSPIANVPPPPPGNFNNDDNDNGW